MNKIEEKDLFPTCPIHPLERFTDCIEFGVEVKSGDTSCLIRGWGCRYK